MRRSFHTLKGSGRMVNARAISDFAWAIENLLNRILDGTLQRSPPVLQTLRAAIAALPQLVAELESGSGERTDLAPLAARAHALASGREELAAASSTVTAATLAGQGAARLAEVAAAGASPVSALPKPTVPAGVPPVPAAATSPAAVAKLAGVEPAAAEPATAQSASSEPDAALREIYARETASHVGTVRAWLPASGAPAAPHVLPEEVYRACHTLVGSSTMAEARHGIRLAEPMNHWLRKSFDSGVGLDDSDLMLLGDCMVAMEAVAGHLDEGTGFFVMHDTLRGRIARAELDLDRRIAEANELAGRSSISLPVPPMLAEPPASTPEPMAVSSAPAATRLAPPPPAAPIKPPAAPAHASEADRADFDPEIAAIFSEEAVELLESAESALAAWNASPGEADLVAALRRPLHTLKGGARMAGITAMGELAHELESLVGRIEVGLASADESARDVAQEALDELARMRETIASGRPAAHAPALIARIQSVAGGERPAPEAAAPIEAAAPPEPIVAAQAAAPAVEPEPPPAVPTLELPRLPEAQIAPAAIDVEHLIEIDHEALAAAPAAMEPSAVPMQPEVPAPPMPPEPMPMASAEPLDATLVMAVAEFEPPAPAVELAAPEPVAEAPAMAAEQPAAAAPLPPGREPVVAADRVDMARVSAELLDQLLNNAGEVSISRARLEQQLGSIEFNLGELSRTVTRLKEQLRKLEMETEAQILHRHENEAGHRQEFDPLELDRYSSIQQFSRALAESASDVASIQGLLESLVAEAQNLLQEQSRTVTELQNGLMRTRMVSVQRHVQRLARIVRQAASETGKRAELVVEGASGELDRQVLERMLPPFEHMLRNAVVHGIESPADRIAAGKDEIGHIHLSLRREGAEVIVEVRDDGAGMNLAAIRAKGLELGLIRPNQTLSDEDVMQLVLEPGFSTAGSVTHQAGRGVGMDVVAVEVKKLGGALHMESDAGPRHALHDPPAVHARDQPCAGGAHRR